MDVCPLCSSPERESIETQILKGKLTKRDAAEVLGCGVDEIYEHMTSHIIKSPLVELSSKRNVLLDSLNKLNDNITFVAQSRNYGPIATKQLVELAREVRQTIMSLSDLEGKTGAGQHITIEQYNDFRSIIITNISKLCPKCQDMFLKEIAEAEKTTEAIEKEIDKRKKNAKPVIKVKS